MTNRCVALPSIRTEDRLPTVRGEELTPRWSPTCGGSIMNIERFAPRSKPPMMLQATAAINVAVRVDSACRKAMKLKSRRRDLTRAIACTIDAAMPNYDVIDRAHAGLKAAFDEPSDQTKTQQMLALVLDGSGRRSIEFPEAYLWALYEAIADDEISTLLVDGEMRDSFPPCVIAVAVRIIQQEQVFLAPAELRTIAIRAWGKIYGLLERLEDALKLRLTVDDLLKTENA
jgi:hypothetical protein